MKLKKIVCMAVATILSVGMFVGCGGTNDSGKSDNPGPNYTVNITPDKSTTATLKVGVTNYASEKKIIAELGELLKKEYPNVTVEVVPFSGGISATIGSWYNAGNMPDIFINNSFDMFTLSDKGCMLDLTPYIEAEAASETSNFSVSDYYEAYWKLGQEKFDGAQYMIPRSADRVVCHYNAAIFKAAGVDMSLVKNGWTWEDFDKVCATLRTYYDNNGKSEYYLLDSYMTWEAVYNPVFEAYGVEYFDEDGKVTIDSTETENALSFLKSLIDKRYVAPLSTEQASMMGNKGCMLFHSQATSIVAKELGKYYPDAKKVSDYYDVVTMPVMSGNEKIGCGAAGYSVYANSANRDLAWQFLKLLLSKDGQNIMADSGSNYVSVRKDMADYTDSNNKWGKGYTDMNLAAFTYNSGIGNDPDWNCYTTYIAQQKPKYASNISTTISNLISAYCGGTSYSSAMKTCKNAIERYIKM